MHIIPRQLESNVPIGELGFGPAMVELFGVFILKSDVVWAEHKDNPEKLAQLLIEVIKKNVSLS